jgi:hypothetical protein
LCSRFEQLTKHDPDDQDESKHASDGLHHGRIRQPRADCGQVSRSAAVRVD